MKGCWWISLANLNQSICFKKKQVRDEVVCFAQDLSNYQGQWGLNMGICDVKAYVFAIALPAGYVPECITCEWNLCLWLVVLKSTVGD